MSQEHRMMRITRRDGSEHVILYDAADAELIESRSWHVVADETPGLFYAKSNFRKVGGDGWTTRTMHGVLMGQSGVDHMNRNGLDNRRSNLRPATPSQNAANRPPRPGCTSQYKGVYWHRRWRKWTASVRAGRKRRYLGYFADEVSAAKAYDAVAREMFGEFAVLNFPAEVTS